jgi:hypothetical protein
MESFALFMGMIFWLLLMVAGAAMYFLPTIVAITQHRNNVGVIAVINALLGWSFVGWIVALVMALSKDAQTIQVVQVQQQMGYLPTGYAQPSPAYGHAKSVVGDEIQQINEQAGAGLSYCRQNQQDESAR